MNKITQRIEREAGIPGLVRILADLVPPTDLKSILLEVFRMRSSRLKPAAVLADYSRNPLVRTSKVSALRLAEWEQTAIRALPGEFEVVILSPVCPLGTTSVVTPVPQNWIVTTTQNTEVVSDSTNFLALECAARRREHLKDNPKSAESVHLAASHRLLRSQTFDNPDLVNHFSTFVLCSAGRTHANAQFVHDALQHHIGFYLKALRNFLGSDVKLQLSVTDIKTDGHQTTLAERVLNAIASDFVDVVCVKDDERQNGLGYYRDLCFHIHALSATGQWLELVDGGVVDWTEQYLSNAKERLVISGIGSERLCAEF